MRRADGFSGSAMPPTADVLLNSSETTLWAIFDVNALQQNTRKRRG